MLNLNLPDRQNKIKILCLGSHCDDIEIGCGGTILHLIEYYKNLEFYWVVFSSTEQRKKEALTSAKLFLQETSIANIAIQNFRNSFFPYEGEAIKEYFEAIKADFSPDLILTHYRHDLHQDHRIVSDFTWNTFRNHLIWEYEIPKYDGDLGTPNVFVPLGEAICQRKVQYLLEAFESERHKHWFSEDLFLSLMRLRGMEANSPSRYAEAFYCRKLVVR